MKKYYQVFSSIDIGRNCTKDVTRSFMRSLLPVQDNMTAIQYYIGLVDNQRFQYQLNVSNMMLKSGWTSIQMSC